MPNITTVSLRIPFESGKIWTRINSVFGHFSRSVKLLFEMFWQNVFDECFSYKNGYLMGRH